VRLEVKLVLANFSMHSRDPEDREVDEQDLAEVQEKMLDKTIADSFHASDPPSSDPAPTADPFSA